MKFFNSVTRKNASTLILHAHFDEVLYEIADSIVGFVFSEFFLQFFKVEFDFGVVDEFSGYLYLFLHLHEGVLPVLRNIFSRDITSIPIKFNSLLSRTSRS